MCIVLMFLLDPLHSGCSSVAVGFREDVTNFPGTCPWLEKPMDLGGDGMDFLKDGTSGKNGGLSSLRYWGGTRSLIS